MSELNYNLRIAMIGCGNMGRALLDRILDQDIARPDKIYISVKSQETAEFLKQKYDINLSRTEQAVAKADLIIQAVKAQQLPEVPIVPIQNGAMVVSVSAGTSLSELRSRYIDGKIVRAMPNLGFASGHGITGLCFDTTGGWTAKEKQIVRQIFASGGLIIDIESEEKLDALTAFSGSGPAYLYWFSEAIAQAATKLGFSTQQADQIAIEILIGASEALKSSNKASLAEMRERVTSKGGTTEAALKVLDGSDIQEVVDQALKAAKRRAQELSKN